MSSGIKNGKLFSARISLPPFPSFSSLSCPSPPTVDSSAILPGLHYKHCHLSRPKNTLASRNKYSCTNTRQDQTPEPSALTARCCPIHSHLLLPHTPKRLSCCSPRPYFDRLSSPSLTVPCLSLLTALHLILNAYHLLCVSSFQSIPSSQQNSHFPHSHNTLHPPHSFGPLSLPHPIPHHCKLLQSPPPSHSLTPP